MSDVGDSEPTSITWNTGRLTVYIEIDKNKHALLRSIRNSDRGYKTSKDPPKTEFALGLAELKLSGEGTRQETGQRNICSLVEHRMLYTSHDEHKDDLKSYLDIVCRDPVTGLLITIHYSAFPDVAAIQSRVEVHNTSTEPITIRMISSLILGGLTVKNWWKHASVSYAYNTWFREAQWQTTSLPSVGLDDNGIIELGHTATQAYFSLSNQGSFSTGKNLAMGALSLNDGSRTWMWQIEHNGPWRWEIGDFGEYIYLYIGGPNDQDHQWSLKLSPEEAFTTVPVALTIAEGDLELGFDQITQYRRKLRRRHSDNEKMGVIFNDFMNCLMGDPTDEKITALIQPAARAGAEYFCIDAGWHAELADWWSTVGEWKEIRWRFPHGLKVVIQRIKDSGMIPGLWLEPEVLGLHSNCFSDLPREAYFQRDGELVIQKDRYHLDFSHPAARTRMTEKVEGLIKEFGIGYFKFDYNINMPYGTETFSRSPGHGQLQHNRAYISWVCSLLNAHPDLLIENCSCGGQRMDYANLSVFDIQSTSDQQDPVKYAAVAASVATAVIPEQSGTWAYPQPEWSDEVIAFTVVNSLLGRVHLSGRLDLLSKHQADLVREGMDVYKEIRLDLRGSVPFWPLGLPGWSDEWIAYGLRCMNNLSYISVWRRGGGSEVELEVKIVEPEKVKVEILYPTRFAMKATWDKSKSLVTVTMPAAPCALLLRLCHE